MHRRNICFFFLHGFKYRWICVEGHKAELVFRLLSITLDSLSISDFHSISIEVQDKFGHDSTYFVRMILSQARCDAQFA